jgi:hypothetical protein
MASGASKPRSNSRPRISRSAAPAVHDPGKCRTVTVFDEPCCLDTELAANLIRDFLLPGDRRPKDLDFPFKLAKLRRCVPVVG